MIQTVLAIVFVLAGVGLLYLGYRHERQGQMERAWQERVCGSLVVASGIVLGLFS